MDNNDFYKECLNVLKDKEINDSIVEIMKFFETCYPAKDLFAEIMKNP